MKEKKKWEDLTPEEKKKVNKVSIIVLLVLFLVGFFIYRSCSNAAEEKESEYIGKILYNSITVQLKNRNYHVDGNYLDDGAILWNCQPNISYGCDYTDRVRLFCKDGHYISAICIESLSVDKNLDKIPKSINMYLEIASFLPDTYKDKAISWIQQHYNSDEAETMLDENTKMLLINPVKYYRRLDIFKVTDSSVQTPILNDSLFWCK